MYQIAKDKSKTVRTSSHMCLDVDVYEIPICREILQLAVQTEFNVDLFISFIDKFYKHGPRYSVML